MTKTKTERVLSFLKNGGNLTEGQAKSRFGIANMRATVSNLRFQGYAIYNNHKTLESGRTISLYRLGTPRREVVAAGYCALAQAA